MLERAGLVSRSREAQYRPVTLDATPFRDVTEWLERYRRFWDESMDRLAQYLEEVQAEQASKDKKAKE